MDRLPDSLLDEILAWINPILLYKFRTALTCISFWKSTESINFLTLHQFRWPELVPISKICLPQSTRSQPIPPTKAERLNLLRFSDPDLFEPDFNDRSWCPEFYDTTRYIPVNKERNISWLKTPVFVETKLADGLRMYQAFPESHAHLSNGLEPWLYARALTPGIVSVVVAYIDLPSIVHHDKDRFDPYLTEILDTLTKHCTIAKNPQMTYWVKQPCAKPFCPTKWFSDSAYPHRATVCNAETIRECRAQTTAKYTVSIAMMRVIHRLQPGNTYLTQRVPFSVDELRTEIDIIRRTAVAPS